MSRQRVLVGILGLWLALAGMAGAATISRTPLTHSKSHKVVESSRAQRKMSRLSKSRRSSAAARHSKAGATAHKASLSHSGTRVRTRRHHGPYERFNTSSFTDDVTSGDNTAGEDMTVRAAAIDALGNMNGSVVAIQPTSGRVLAMVNQKMALSSGGQPCSTIKLVTALAALNEGLVERDTRVQLGKYWSMDLTSALAHSNNVYFEKLGRDLGFEKVAYWAHLLGLGERAGLHIDGESPGFYPKEEIPAAQGGVGKMCSFGEGISLTPLQLGALTAAIANGGTLYYLQHPQTPEEVTNLQPVVKRQLPIGKLIPEMSEGMQGATLYGTARSLRANFTESDVLGKTGTCSRDHTRFGWFASYTNTPTGGIVLVVFLQGGRPTFGPKAAEIAGKVYRNLYDRNFFAATPQPSTSAAVSGGGEAPRR